MLPVALFDPLLASLPRSHRTILLSLLLLSSSSSILLLLRSYFRRAPRSLSVLGFEMGGTTCKVSSGIKHFDSNGKLIKVELLTKSVVQSANLPPSETIRQLVEFVKELQFDQVSIAHFGPLCLNGESEQFGRVTSTPKKQWQGFDSLGEFKKLLGAKTKKFVIETDVNAAAMAEFQLGRLIHSFLPSSLLFLSSLYSCISSSFLFPPPPPPPLF